MGRFQLGVPKDLVFQLKRAFGIKNFIETGTHLGASALWASDHFPNTFTVEASEVFFRKASAALAGRPGISVSFGDSRVHLPQIIAKISGPALFWLDGHYSGDETFGEKDECPLLKEIDCINASKDEHFILIDDARLFTAPPPHPHDASQWPTIDVLCKKLQQGPNPRYIIVYEDVIYAVPLAARSLLLPLIQSRTSADWSKYMMEKTVNRDRILSPLSPERLLIFSKKLIRFFYPKST